MHRETISILRARACKTIGRVLTVLVFSTAFLRPDLAIGRGFHPPLIKMICCDGCGALP